MPILSNFPTGGRGPAGENGGYYSPSVDEEGNLSFTPSKDGMPSIDPVNIKGPAGADGATGATGATGPAGADGNDATINGQNVLTIEGSGKVTATQDGTTLTLDTPNAV